MYVTGLQHMEGEMSNSIPPPTLQTIPQLRRLLTDSQYLAGIDNTCQKKKENGKNKELKVNIKFNSPIVSRVGIAFPR